MGLVDGDLAVGRSGKNGLEAHGLAFTLKLMAASEVYLPLVVRNH